ncbi:MAG: hypothetical protein HKN92_03960 [Chitinophagales bacterium]|nr:hypothetical protein [Chitinophagales bacterium]
MKTVIQKYTAIFCLLALSFLSLADVLHKLHHADDIPCTVEGAHFHDGHHHSCSLCDFIPSSVFINSTEKGTVDHDQFLFVESFYEFDLYFSQEKVSYLLRGPPISYS